MVQRKRRPTSNADSMLVLRAKRQLAGLIAALFELVRSQRRRSEAA
jgi:hypothetical protein